MKWLKVEVNFFLKFEIFDSVSLLLLFFVFLVQAFMPLQHPLSRLPLPILLLQVFKIKFNFQVFLTF